MQLGVVLPQTELGASPTAVRRYATEVERLGYGHVLAYDHVVGADRRVHDRWRANTYDVDSAFFEPFVVFSHIAAITTLDLVTAVIILPQRQTTLVAKQAATLDVLSEGRLRLGVGIGWNAVEYEALGERFSLRARKFEEQIELLRLLWSRPSVTFQGEFHRVVGAGINPLPLRRSIPLLVGGSAPVALRRAGRVADGWIPNVPVGDGLRQAIDIVHEAAVEAGRDPASLSMYGRVTFRGDIAELIDAAHEWRELGATHLSVDTMGASLMTVDDHLAVLGEFLGAAGGLRPESEQRQHS
ncbi:LLM class F420-dependent oxidoreductase [Saccharomonospora sp. NPDC046836]|uniref:LLM class F420-dependent oxidoreductase n=1 Tax=Saccharomonospora sp. NPDC046836 TaxID=3156921 RepID=UPI0033D10E72